MDDENRNSTVFATKVALTVIRWVRTTFRLLISKKHQVVGGFHPAKIQIELVLTRPLRMVSKGKGVPMLP